MIKLDRPVIVEGRYDKTTLENVIDALIIPTDGFQIFKDREKCRLIRTLAEKNGVIVLTDSDSAGHMIRSHLKKIIGNEKIIHVYIPQVKGKEKRKDRPGKEGLLGVEGMSAEIILAALQKSGVIGQERKSAEEKITKTDFYCCGLSGGTDSAALRKSFLRFLALPVSLSPSAMLDILNTMLSRGEFQEKVMEWQENRDKSLS